MRIRLAVADRTLHRMCALYRPEARFGVAANVVILVLLLVGAHANSVPTPGTGGSAVGRGTLSD